MEERAGGGVGSDRKILYNKVPEYSVWGRGRMLLG